MVVNRGDSLSKPMLSEAVGALTFGLGQPDFKGFGLLRDDDGQDSLAYEFTPLLPLSALKMAGRHNVENALAALALGQSVGLPMAAMLAVLQRFAGLPHRSQFVAEVEGVRCYDDSKGTNVGATIAAVTGLADSADKVVLIAGGQGKGADFAPLKAVLAKHARAVVLIGEAADELQQLLAGSLPLMRADSMAEAVRQAVGQAQAGDAVLLSPACASFDMFNSFEHRGDVFQQAVQALVEVEQ